MKSLEICADGLFSAIAASVSGVQRIELCANLEAGGLTPSAGTMKVVRARVGIPVHVLIRPRRGDYVYTPACVDIMLNDILFAKELGFEGVVIGVLDKNGKLETSQMNELLDAASGMSVTFHRAIDVAANPDETIEQLIQLGVNRVLTSGGRATAWEGREAIARYQRNFGEHIAIMAGSGINSTNVVDILNVTNIKEVHASAKSIIQTAYTHTPDPSLVKDDWHIESAHKEIKALMKALNLT